MKYNTKEIMARAWEIKRQDRRNDFGLCLRMSWEEAKEGKRMNGVSEKQINYAIDAQARQLAQIEKISHYWDNDAEYAAEVRKACDHAAAIVKGFTEARDVLDIGDKVVAQCECICSGFAPDRGYGFEYVLGRKPKLYAYLSGEYKTMSELEMFRYHQ